MRPRKLDAESKEIIGSLLDRLIKDLNNGISLDPAGWVAHSRVRRHSEIVGQLESQGYLERHPERGSRVNYLSARGMNQIKKEFPLQHDQIRYFVEERQRDDVRTVRSTEVVHQAGRYLSDSPDLWTPVVLLGWWRMLSYSGLPAVIDAVLDEGFSPKQWSVKAIQASPQLSLSIARTIGRVESFQSATERFQDLGFGPEGFDGAVQIDGEDLDRIVRILHWRRIESEVPESTIKALGFWWFILLILDTSDVIPHSDEALGQLYRIVWGIVEDTVGKSRSTLLAELDRVVEVLDEAKIPWARDILRFPEAI